MPDFTRSEDIRALYQKRAAHYDFTANLYYLIGFREHHYRRKAVDALELEAGDTVVEIGCGTGLNFGLLEEAVGPSGRIIGVDLTDAMLAQARERVATQGWTNVELVHTDAADYTFPDDVDGILATFAITVVPEYDAVIARGARALAPGGRWAILELKRPSGWARLLTPLMIAITRPFGVSEALAERHPWESLDRHMAHVRMDELYLGFAYLAVGASEPLVS